MYKLYLKIFLAILYDLKTTGWCAAFSKTFFADYSIFSDFKDY